MMSKLSKFAGREVRGEMRANEELASAEDWRDELDCIGAEEVRGRRPWAYGALQKRVGRAAIEFEIATGALTEERKEEWFQYSSRDWPKYGPTNVVAYNHQNNPSYPKQLHDLTPEDRRAVQTETFLRMAGWLRAASAFPTLVEFIRCTQSGMANSPYTTQNLWDFVAAHPSPGEADHYLRNVAYQCNRFLRGFGMSFRGAWGEVFCEKRASRAGKLAAMRVLNRKIGRITAGAATIGKMDFLLYRGFGMMRQYDRPTILWAVERINAGEFACLRDALLVSTRLVRDDTDGVSLLIDPVQVYRKQHVTVDVGYGTGEKGFPMTQFLVRAGNRSYHDGNRVHYGTEAMRKDAIKMALRAWGKQKKFGRANADLLSLLKPSNVTWLVTRQDSYAAGNCQAGTEAWMSAHGIRRDFVPVDFLLHHVEDPRVMRVLNAVAERVKRDQHLLSA